MWVKFWPNDVAADSYYWNVQTNETSWEPPAQYPIWHATQFRPDLGGYVYDWHPVTKKATWVLPSDLLLSSRLVVATSELERSIAS